MLTFRNLSLFTALLALTLCTLLLLAPQLVFALFGVEGNAPAYFISRRAAFLFLGYATLAFLSRDAANSVARQAIIAGVGVMMGGLAILGAAEWLRGYAGPGILLAVGGEAVIAAACLYLWLTNRAN